MATRKEDADIQPDRLALHALMVDDSPRDVKLIVSTLKRGGYNLTYEAVDSVDLMQSLLSQKEFDVIIADYRLRGWTALEALEIVKKSGKDIPFIVVTGTLEDVAAVSCIKEGAADYILKDRMARLPSAIKRALDEKQSRGEHKRVEAENRRLATAIEQIAEGVVITDVAGNIEYANPAFTWMTGYSREEVLNRNTRLLKSGVQDNRVYEGLWQTIKSGKTWQGEIINRRKDGSLYPEWMTIAPVLDSAGKVVNFISIKQDNSRRKLAEEALRKSEDRYRDLVEHSRDLICTHDLSGKLLSVNPEPARILGYTPAELMKINMPDFLAPDVRDKFENYLTKIKRDGKAEGLMVVQARSGEKRVWEYSNTLRTEGVQEPVVRGMAHDVTERMRAEKASRKNEAALEEAQRISHVGSWEWDITENKHTWSDELYRIFGLEPRSVVPSLEIGLNAIHAGDRERVRRELESSLQTSTTYEIDFRAIRPDGTERVVHAQGNVVRNSAGIPLKTVGTAQDVTEFKRVEAALRASEKRYRLLFEGNPGPMWVYDLDSLHFIAVNDAAIQHYGYSRGEFLSMTIKDIRPPEDIPALLNDIARAKEGVNHSGTWRHRKKDGSIIDVEITSHPIDFGGGRSELVLANDVTERKRAVELMRLSEERFRKAFDMNPEPVTISTLVEGRYIHANETFLRTMGFDREEIIGHTSKEIEYWEKAEDRERFIAEIKRNGRVHGMEINFRTKSGQMRAGLLSAETLRLDEKECLLSVTKDITDYKNLELQFRQTQKMEAIGKLAGGVAHDFNNILTVINGYAELMLAQLQPENPHKNYVNEIRKAGERASGLTRQLLAFSRQQVLAPQVLDLNNVFESVHTMLKRLIGEDIDLVTIPGKSLGQVKADPGQIEQVLLNLAVNARDAMVSGGKLTIETANVDLDESYAQNHVSVVPGPYVMLAVTDSGSGMNAEIQRHIFEPFFTTKEKGKGTGLGLSTVYGIIKQSGGYIWVYSEVGRGSTFKLYLPRVEAAVDIAPPSKEGPELRRGTETVLLVEDDVPIRTLVRSTLAGHGYTILEAPDGADALLLAAQHKGTIHILLTDLVMPGISGRTLAQHLAVTHPETKVLYMSGYTDDAVIRHGGLESGAAFLQKPFTPETLARKVRDVLGSGHGN
ncbi:MAG TPA: PAS domain S-box protein [Terriglobia bacterium]|nr:PAS domain S-box protein [Terriglobia bacterium]